MFRALCFPVVAAVLLVASSASQPSTVEEAQGESGLDDEGVSEAGFTQEEQTEILTLHNKFRRNVKPSAANMVPLRWGNWLGKKAQKWANTCPNSNERDPDVGDHIGQIVAWGEESITQSLNRMFQENAAYDFDSNKCRGICGNYTQLVWANTENVGCGSTSCGEQNVFVCYYNPGGNVFDKPYISGSPCSQCPADYSRGCQENMCQLG